MDAQGPQEEYVPTFYIGHHESNRIRVGPELLRQAQDCGYDMLTTPITTPYFHNRVLELWSNYIHELRFSAAEDVLIPIIPPLTPTDTPLAPNETISQLLAVVSPWIDLCSPDPAVYELSRQVLELEIAYAAFCGVGNIILPSPRLHHGKVHGECITQYARAVQEALNIGQYISLSVTLSMMDSPDQECEDNIGGLAEKARGEFMGLPPDDQRESFEMDEKDDEGTVIVSRKQPARVDFFGTWDAWHMIRTSCKYSNRLFVALSIPSHLPPAPVQTRWFSEPLRLLIIYKSTFFNNKHDLPAFTHNHQALLNQYMRIRNPPWLILSDIGPIPGIDAPKAVFSPADGNLPLDQAADPPLPSLDEDTDLQRKSSTKSTKPANLEPLWHLNYLRKLQRRQPPQDVIERFGAGYQDYLQAPLQPLTDNLESVTYEVFEKDPVKYERYSHAIELALLDWRAQSKQASAPDGRVVVAVVGAGRGPLVTKALQVSESTGVEIEMWLVEKNPNAYVILQNHNIETWSGRVNLVKSDMRSWKGPYSRQARPETVQPSGYTGQWPPRDDEPAKAAGMNASPSSSTTTNAFPNQPPPSTASSASFGPIIHHTIDILISELLGSFGDNELSPECLEPMIPLLNPIHGISIPRSYTAYLTPIAAPKLHADISSRAEKDPQAPDTPYVVMLHAIDYLSTTGRSLNSKSTPPPSSMSIPQPVPNVLPSWSFTHTTSSPPTTAADNNRHNERHARLSFNLRDRAACHGLAGYFEALLYESEGSGEELLKDDGKRKGSVEGERTPKLDMEKQGKDKGKAADENKRPDRTWAKEKIELSTHPVEMAAKCEGMMSWFPIYFPLKTPLYTPDHATLNVSIFRATDGRKIWYEWSVEAFASVLGQGIGGGGGAGGMQRRRVRLGGSEVGSSRVGGCMM